MSNSGQTLGEAAPIRDSVASRQRERPDLQQINTGNLHSKGKRQSDTARRVSLAQPSGTAGSTSVTEAVFEQLRVIQALQEEIAADHIKLENLQNNGATTSTPGSVTSPNLGASRNQFRPRGTGATAASKANTLNPQANKQAAAAAYDKLAEGFEERQKDVEAIMNKLSQLSVEVKRFQLIQEAETPTEAAEQASPSAMPDTPAPKTAFVDSPLQVTPPSRRFP